MLCAYLDESGRHGPTDKTPPQTSGSAKARFKNVKVHRKSILARMNFERFSESPLEGIEVKPCLRANMHGPEVDWAKRVHIEQTAD
jgi:hypothetical protein